MTAPYSDYSSPASRFSPASCSPACTPFASAPIARWLRHAGRVLASRPHLTALLALSALALGALWVLGIFADRLDANYVHMLLASGEEPNAPRSLALARCILRQPDLLPLYGSSELLDPVPQRAPEFFRTYPTGFSILSIGQAGAGPLLLLQQLAGLGPELRGRKVAIALSSGWFRENEMPTASDRDHFLPATARELLFSPHLSLALRTSAAQRLLRFPGALERDPISAFAARHLATGTPLDRLAYWSAWPLGRLQIAGARCQDDFTLLGAALRWKIRPAPVHRIPGHLDWPALLDTAAREAGDQPGQDIDPAALSDTPRAGDPAFLARLQNSPAWGDLQLLLQALRELGARPLLLCPPLHGPTFAAAGVSHTARTAFYRRLTQTVSPYGFTLRAFADHDADRHFTSDRCDHLSAKGWMYYNRALDAFAHNRAEGSYNITEDLP